MQNALRYVAGTLILLSSIAHAQEHSYSVCATGSFTSSSKLFSNITNPDELARGQFLALDDVFSGGIEVRRELNTIRVTIGFSVEYLERTNTSENPDSSILIPVKDGFRSVPIELTALFFLPFQHDRLRVGIGGGVGVYLGNRIYEYARTPAPTIEHRIGFGIHVVTGVEYLFAGPLSVRGTVEFRDVQFETVNRFQQPVTVYDRTLIQLPQEPLYSRVNIDGTRLTLGLAYSF